MIRAVAALAIATGPFLLGDALAGADPGFSAIVQLPTPTGAGATTTSVSSVSCPSTSSCTAIGITGAGEPYAVTETSGTWGTPQPLQLPTAGVAENLALTCTDIGNCLAAGSYQASDGAVVPLVVEEVAGTWGALGTALVPSDARTGASENAALIRPWCSLAGTCEVVGLYEGSSTWELMTLGESGGTWGVPRSIGSSQGAVIDGGQIIGGLAFTCTAIGDCVLATDADTRAEDGGAWGTPRAWDISLLPANSTFGVTAIGCPDAGICLAVGTTYTIGCDGNCRPSWEATSAVESAGTWTAPTERGPGPLGGYSDMSCQPGECVAVGYVDSYNDFDPYDLPAATTWSNGAWSDVKEVSIPLEGDDVTDASSFAGISCASEAECVAVGDAGEYTSNNGPHGLYPFSTVLAADSAATQPGVPTSVVATPGLEDVNVSWTPPADDGGAPVTTYTATVEPSGLSCTTQVTSCVLTGLDNGKQYVVIVTDTNGTASSSPAYSNHVFVGEVPSTPRGMHGTASKRTLVVSWHASTTPAGESVLRYEVVATAGTHSMTCITTSVSCLLRTLVRGRVYAISVAAYDVTGWSHRATIRVIAP
jgi:hypothetical protein